MIQILIQILGKSLNRQGRQPLPNTPSNQYFSSVIPGGPADRAGIREGDYVIEVRRLP